MQGSKDSYTPQVHSLHPHAQPELYPPPPPPPPPPPNPQAANQYQYQGYFGEAANPPYTGSWSWSEQQQPAPSSDGGPFHYQDDADCITFLRGCLTGLCCCCLLEQCCFCY